MSLLGSRRHLAFASQTEPPKRNVAKGIALSAAITVMCASGAVPRLADSVGIEQSRASDLVTVTYRLLDAEAIVTVDFQTNGVSIGEMNFNNVYGDGNRLIQPSESVDRHVYWRPSRSWPEGGLIESGFSVKVTVWPTTTPPDYLVVDLLGTSSVRYYVSPDALPGDDQTKNSLGILHPIYKTHKLAMRRVPAQGVTFTMGSPTSGPESYARDLNRETPHKVTLTNDFYLAVFETTQGQWHYLGGGADFTRFETASATLPSGDAYPVTGLCYNNLRGTSWPSDRATHDLGGNTTSTIALMRQRFSVDFDLPTDAQWEFACRAGCSTSLYNGYNIPEQYWWYGYYDGRTTANEYPPLDEIAWYEVNAEGTIHPVGMKKPNDWGFYDMLGNASEWVLDWAERMSYEPQGVVSGDDVTEPFGREANSVYGETISGVQFREAKYHQMQWFVSPYVVEGRPESGLLPGIEPYNPHEKDGDGDKRVQAYCFRMCLTDDQENRIPFKKPVNYDEMEYELLFRNFAKGENAVPWINSKMPNRKTDTNNRLGFSTDFIGRNYEWPEASYKRRAEIFKAHLDYRCSSRSARSPEQPRRLQSREVRGLLRAPFRMFHMVRSPHGSKPMGRCSLRHAPNPHRHWLDYGQTSSFAFKQPDFASRALRCLLDGPHTAAEVARKLKLCKSGRITDALECLVEAGFVMFDNGKNPEKGEELRENRYRMSDNYCRFYLKFVEPAKTVIDRDEYEFAELDALENVDSVMGLAFVALVYFGSLSPVVAADVPRTNPLCEDC